LGVTREIISSNPNEHTDNLKSPRNFCNISREAQVLRVSGAVLCGFSQHCKGRPGFWLNNVQWETSVVSFSYLVSAKCGNINHEMTKPDTINEYSKLSICVQNPKPICQELVPKVTKFRGRPF
jgi:hypothetical protein